jgi:benzoyl-CoA reductase/2-hydroxyglutaryl-CoA dehydratase subunit BcrC/BadD/HgdB
MEIIKKIKDNIWIVLSGIGTIALVVIYFFRPSTHDLDLFPESEKKKLEDEADKTKEEIEKIEDKTFSDKEIEDTFNKK